MIYFNELANDVKVVGQWSKQVYHFKQNS